MTKGEESTSRALMIPFLAIHAKGGESEPKAKGPHHHQFQKFSFSKSILNWYPIMFKRGVQRVFSIGTLLCSKEGESSISKMIYQNPLEH
jgi:hypothetical protein